MRFPRTRSRVVALASLGAAMAPLVLASPAMAQDASAGQTLASLNPLAALTLDDAPNFAGKPLFSASRRPPPDAFVPTTQLAPPPPPPPSAAGLQLIGTVRTRDGTMARIQDAASGSTQSVKPGDMIGGWTVTSIEAAAVQLEQAGNTAKLELFGAVRSPEAPPAPLGEPSRAASEAPGSSPLPPSDTLTGTAGSRTTGYAPAQFVFGTADPSAPAAPAPPSAN